MEDPQDVWIHGGISASPSNAPNKLKELTQIGAAVD